MQSTRMPGFTADAGDYPSGNSYRSMSAGAGPTTTSGVFTSFVSPRGRCIQGCICVTPEGCPCCESIFTGARLPRTRMAMNAGVSNAGAGDAGSLVDTVDAWCTAHGGGMASMADGTVQCFL